MTACLMPKLLNIMWRLTHEESCCARILGQAAWHLCGLWLLQHAGVLSRGHSAPLLQKGPMLVSPAPELCINDMPLQEATRCCLLSGCQSPRSRAGRLVCREQLNAVILSLEDELSVLDLRYADLLRQAQERCSSDAEDAEASALLSTCMAPRMRGCLQCSLAHGILQGCPSRRHL